MRQQVNLFLPEFRRQTDWLDFRRMAWLAGLALLLFVAVSALRGGQLVQLQGELEDRQAALTAAVNETTALVQRYGVQTEDQALADSVRQLEETLQGKKVLLDFLAGRELGNTAGFSGHLADLSRYLVPGLRLTAIELRRGGGGVLLSGQVSHAANVTLFLRNLSQSPAYAGKSFDALRIEDAAAGSGSAGLHVFDVSSGMAVQP